MSWQSAEEPEAKAPPACKALKSVIVPRPRDIGGFEVRRVLPSLELRSVGPFVFFDQMGSAELAPGQGNDVRPHPHIGLATVTYLFSGTIVHRDSLGSVQAIEPGAVNCGDRNSTAFKSGSPFPKHARKRSLASHTTPPHRCR